MPTTSVFFVWFDSWLKKLVIIISRKLARSNVTGLSFLAPQKAETKGLWIHGHLQGEFKTSLGNLVRSGLKMMESTKN